MSKTNRSKFAAAKRINRTQSAISLQIAKLEERGLPIALIAAVEVSTRKAAELDASSDESE